MASLGFNSASVSVTARASLSTSLAGVLKSRAYITQQCTPIVLYSFFDELSARSSNENKVVLISPQGDNFRKINGSDLPFAIMHECVLHVPQSVRNFYARALNSRMVEMKMNENDTKNSRQTMR